MTLLPAAFVAVKVYVVVDEGKTTLLPLVPTLPTPGVIVTLEAFAVFQESVRLPPCAKIEEEEVKLETDGGCTTESTQLVVVVPLGLLAVSVYP